MPTVPSPQLRILCCRCGDPIRRTDAVYALDGEWQRRHPHMRGVLSCQDCALRNGWGFCEPRRGALPDGHVPVGPGVSGCDFWSHILDCGPHKRMVLQFPWSGLLQGAEAYLRFKAAERDGATMRAAELALMLRTWGETPHSLRSDTFGTGSIAAAPAWRAPLREARALPAPTRVTARSGRRAV